MILEHPKNERLIVFLILRSNQTHKFADVLRGYADFILGMRNHAPRKLKIKDADESAINWLRRIAEMKNLSRIDSAYWLEQDGEAYAYYSNPSKGLRNKLGLGNERLKDSPLHNRLVF